MVSSSVFLPFAVRHLSSFVGPPPSSSIVSRYLSPLCPFRISRFPDLHVSPTQGPRGPPCSAVREHAESSRGGVSGTKKIPGEPFSGPQKPRKMGALPLGFGPKVPKGSERNSFRGPEQFQTPYFVDLAEKKESAAENRNFARTPGHRVPQSPELHASSICQIPGFPGIPPPAALTSLIFTGFLPRLFSSFSVLHLSSFLFPSGIFSHRLP